MAPLCGPYLRHGDRRQTDTLFLLRWNSRVLMTLNQTLLTYVCPLVSQPFPNGEYYQYTHLHSVSPCAARPSHNGDPPFTSSTPAGFDPSNTVFEEQNYAKLRILLQELRGVDKTLAAKIGISILQLEGNLQDRAVIFSFDVFQTEFREYRPVCLIGCIGRKGTNPFLPQMKKMRIQR